MHQNSNVQILKYLEQGDYIYELYSVLVHSGGAMGGHYYAYIKSFEDGKWYNFNDSIVSQIQEDDISRVFGDMGGGCATAYMLMYKQYNPALKENPVKIPDETIPVYLKSEIEEETVKLIQIQQEKQEKLLTVKIKVYH
mmetsp:Transcript_42854/g.41177  ORF Transcript_42854/g.41177 Transcript_42854/m.41177 type:complete len:139 (+) Transcript_42854:1457-1873(+)